MARGDDFIQPGMLFRQVMTPTDREHLASNIIGHLCQGAPQAIQERAVHDYWVKVDAELGAQIARSLGLSLPLAAAQLSGASV